ncbi:MAG: hypothetical protein M0R33_20985 [Methylomonas sp.]|jgi:hypothetical protein|uniref:hypothetical protein n=1 Tax=Methylomonas sp. TaxID=418 RepID=UPI0025F31343|nr:hypothetical protein [Methylomonas sp.]MCK9608924.1 hypothetical protein [Methylomonas sp.]
MNINESVKPAAEENWFEKSPLGSIFVEYGRNELWASAIDIALAPFVDFHLIKAIA